jgi:hypothetical protein
MTLHSFSRFASLLALCVSMNATAVQNGGPVGPRDPPPPPEATYTARTYYKIVIIPGTAANNWTATYVNSSISSTTTEPTCASAFAAHMAYIASHSYIYANYRTCN